MANKKFVVITDTGNNDIQCLGITNSFNEAIAIAYLSASDKCENVYDRSYIITPLSKLEGDRGYTFTYTQPRTGHHREITTLVYILETKEEYEYRSNKIII